VALAKSIHKSQDVSQEALVEKVNAAHSKELQYAFMNIEHFIGLQSKKLC